MKGLILAAASVIALGMGSAGAATLHHNARNGMNPTVGKTAFSRTQSKAFSKHRLSGRRMAKSRVTGGKVKKVQQALKRDHLYRGKIDGLIGPQTRQALAKFQKENGLRVTATLDRSTLAGLMRGGTVGYGSSRTHRSTSPGQTRSMGQMPTATGSSGQTPASGNTGNTTPGNSNLGTSTGANTGTTTK